MDYTVEIDHDASVPQGDETFVLVRGGERTTMRIHDYDDVYAVPGLYEHVVQERLECLSPQMLGGTLAEQVAAAGEDAGAVRALDVGAGNGVSGEALRHSGLTPVVGLDISPVSREATERDRPGLYEEFIVGGLEDVDPAGLVERHRLTALVGAGALTGGHIEPSTLAETWEAFPSGAWLAFTCPEAHADGARDVFEGTSWERDEPFRHRILTDRTPLTYRVIVGRRG